MTRTPIPLQYQQPPQPPQALRPVRRRDRERSGYVWVTYAVALAWCLLPFGLIAIYGIEHGMGTAHWVSTGAMPMPIGKGATAPMIFFVWARFCLPAMFAILIAEASHAIAGKFPD